MLNREELFERFIACLETSQPLPDFLGEAPVEPEPFDPYQMIGEWIALRYEVKQQGKLLLATQDTLQQALKTVQSEKEQLQRRLEESQQQVASQRSTDSSIQKQQAEREQEKLLKDLLGVMDALDQAYAHWQDELNSSASSSQHSSPSQSIWQRFFQTPQPSNLPLTEVMESNRQGIELIRRSLLDILRQRQVVPIQAQGKPFDSRLMYAVGRQETNEMPENTIYREVTRGYLWKDQVLREAQVIVAVNGKDAGEKTLTL